MEKGGGILVIIAIILGSLVIVALGAGIYFYNFFVFKEVRLCIGEGVDSDISCVVRQDCIDALGIADVDLKDVPDFLGNKFQEILDEVVYCDETCFVKNVRGIDPETQELEELESCEGGEKEIVVEIRGKEGLEIWKWMKSRE